MKLFEYAVWYVPTEKQAKEGEHANLVLGPSTTLAKDEKEAQFRVVRSIPEAYADKFEQLTVAVRPF